MRRSSSGSWRAGAGVRSRAGGAAFAGLRRWGWDLATVPPGNEESKNDVEAAEAGSQEIVGPGSGREERECSGGHEAEAHDGDDGNRVGASGDDSGAVEQEPGGGEGGLKSRTLQQES